MPKKAPNTLRTKNKRGLKKKKKPYPYFSSLHGFFANQARILMLRLMGG